MFRRQLISQPAKVPSDGASQSNLPAWVTANKVQSLASTGITVMGLLSELCLVSLLVCCDMVEVPSSPAKLPANLKCSLLSNNLMTKQ